LVEIAGTVAAIFLSLEDVFQSQLEEAGIGSIVLKGLRPCDVTSV
jgi:hypothetical protein